MTAPRVCVIGAGSSGLPVIKALLDRGIAVDAYEKSDRIGGNWVFGNKNGMSAAYRSLHINTSRDSMQYADYPMPADYPDFPHHTLIARYFDAYADHFKLRPHIRFETGVARVERAADGSWDVATDTGERHGYDMVVVANGHHWSPRMPTPMPPGTFDGEVMHSHAYIDPTEPLDLRGKRVVVVGMGNSAMDIACELSREGVAARVLLSARRGAHVVPHYLFGKPADRLATLPPWMPWPIKRAAFGLLYRFSVGDVTRFGLPRPDHRLGEAHPTVSSDILSRMGRGAIAMRPAIAALEGRRVRFSDDSVEEVDAIVYCTGYHVRFPFFDPGLIDAPDNDLPLFLRVWKPGLDNLAFVGLLQPLGSVMPLAEAQARWIAAYLAGDYHLPPAEQMQRHMARERAALHRRYVTSARHTMQVDFKEYLWELGREQRRGHRRAHRDGHRPPVPSRATPPPGAQPEVATSATPSAPRTADRGPGPPAAA